MDYIKDEIPKHKKKVKKTVKKSKHKHIYKDCLFFERNSNEYKKGEYCEVCGKIGDFKLFEGVRINNRLSRMLSQEEILEKYKDLEIKEVENLIEDKNVAI